MPALCARGFEKLVADGRLADRTRQKLPRTGRCNENIRCRRKLCDVGTKVPVLETKCVRQNGGKIHGAIREGLTAPNLRLGGKERVDGLALIANASLPTCAGVRSRWGLLSRRW